jgi:hypothetical protein
LTVGRYAKRREAHYLDVQDRIEEIERTRGDLAVKDEPDVAAAKAQRLEKRLAYAFSSFFLFPFIFVISKFLFILIIFESGYQY